jgi:uncharacterized protein (TIGR02145 family)
MDNKQFHHHKQYKKYVNMLNPYIFDKAIKDFDGNTYTSVVIGTQTWLVENLKTTHYNNGDAIGSDFSGTVGAVAQYPSAAVEYGKLYNQYAVDDIRGIAPIGYHVPSVAEYDTLIAYLGGVALAGGKMKEDGLTHWNFDATGTNESGFTAIGAGVRNPSGGVFEYLKVYCDFWTTNSGAGKFLWMQSAFIDPFTGLDKKYGLTVRCIKD